MAKEGVSPFRPGPLLTEVSGIGMAQILAGPRYGEDSQDWGKSAAHFTPYKTW